MKKIIPKETSPTANAARKAEGRMTKDLPREVRKALRTGRLKDNIDLMGRIKALPLNLGNIDTFETSVNNLLGRFDVSRRQTKL